MEMMQTSYLKVEDANEFEVNKLLLKGWKLLTVNQLNRNYSSNHTSCHLIYHFIKEEPYNDDKLDALRYSSKLFNNNGFKKKRVKDITEDE